MESDALKEALLKVALGFSVEEVTEEYGVEDGELKLLKRRETRKDIPPDLKAVKLMMDEDGEISALTDEQLEEERKKLLKVFEEEESEKNRK